MPGTRLSRRDFLAASAATTLTMMSPIAFPHVVGSDRLKVGLIGCGGRGTGAARDCVGSIEGLTLTAMGDLFADRLESSAADLKAGLGERYQVTGETMFSGFDAYRKVIGSGVDVVILTAPPGFRPAHLAAAVEAGKHVFMEKPVAVDAPGVRSVIASGETAREKGLSIVAGTQRRYEPGYRDVIARIRDGAIGEVVAGSCHWNQGGLWMYPRKAEWSDVEWQIRNWLYFTWLSGDQPVEQHIHNIDVINWALGATPVKAFGTGGRQVRTDPAYGHVFDHFAVELEYPNGAVVTSMCRQQDGTATKVGELLIGTKGRSNAAGWIKGENAYRFEGPRPNPYVEEHIALIRAIRTGTPINEAKQVAESTMSAIMVRTAAYTGQEVTWDELMASEASLVPDTLEFGQMPVAPVPTPGRSLA